MTLQAQIQAGFDRLATAINSLFSATVPAGGTIGQVLTKTGSPDHAFGWAAPSGGSSASGGVPPGTVIFRREGQPIPAGYLRLDGSYISPSLYPNLSGLLPTQLFIEGSTQYPSGNIIATASNSDGGTDPSQLIDGADYIDDGWYAENYGNDVSIVLELAQSTLIKGYTIKGSNYFNIRSNPAWSLYGSNNSSLNDKQLIDSRPDTDFSLGESKTFLINAPQQFKFYVFVLSSYTDNFFSFAEIKLLDTVNFSYKLHLIQGGPMSGNLNPGYQILIKY